MIARGAHHLPKAGRVRGFTLVELLITISIIGIMASMVVFAMFQSQEAAREQKTRALITKLNNIIMQRYESYRTRRVPFIFPSGEAFTDTNANGVRDSTESFTDYNGNGYWDSAYNYPPSVRAKVRLDCLRDIMRMEMPDRWTDVADPPAAPFDTNMVKIQRPSVNQAYFAKYTASTPSADLQGAECLYMIVMAALAQEGDSRDIFKSTDVGDFDNDGYPEFQDAWQRPIRFLRWAPGFDSPSQVIGRISPFSNSTAGQSVRVRFPGQYFAPKGNYIGNVLAVIEPGTEQINSSRMGTVTGYEHTGAQAILTCSTPSGQPQPFSGGVPTTTSTVVMLGADPFDPRRVFPNFSIPETSTPNFNLIPLIYSGGSDRAFGIVADVPLPGKIQYSAVRLYPCYVPVGTPFGQMMGTKYSSTGEPENAWLDNITSHDLSRR